MSDLERVLMEQRECRDYLSGDGPDRDGAMHGASDWVHEECLIGGEYQATNRYRRFLDSKRLSAPSAGFAVSRSSLHPKLFDFQRDIAKWSIGKGKAAIFADCGLGKSFIELEWSAHVHDKVGRPILNVAPLAVSRQTQREGEKFGIQVNVCREQAEVKPGVNITNYEMLGNFDPREFGGFVCDESGILKGDGPLRRDITDFAPRDNN